MAVGTFGGDLKNLAESWNGKAWSITPTPSPGANLNELDGVSCTSSSFCVAVGRDNTKSDRELTLAEIWNGTKWSVTPTLSKGLQNALFGVSCTSPATCMAVGHRDSSNRAFETLAESWNGKAWSIVPSPSVSTNSILFGVSCTRATACIAVGQHDSTFGAHNLAESWNGTSWSLQSTPNRAPQGANGLLGVSCGSATSCQAVGFFAVGTGALRTAAESWNGRRWSIVTVLDRGSEDNELAGVSCTAPANCVAVGFNRYGPPHGPGNGQSLIESWNGSQWSVSASPSPRPDTELFGVTCTSATTCEAAGYDGKGSLLSDKTLIETGT
jgi:hypothetical protein